MGMMKPDWNWELGINKGIISNCPLHGVFELQMCSIVQDQETSALPTQSITGQWTRVRIKDWSMDNWPYLPVERNVRLEDFRKVFDSKMVLLLLQANLCQHWGRDKRLDFG